MTQKIFLAGLAVLAFLTSEAQKKAKPEDTEFYTPIHQRPAGCLVRVAG